MAWGLDDILKLLDRWGEWRRMRDAPTRIDELEKRVQELEQKLVGPYPPDVCRLCGERAARLTRENSHAPCQQRDFRYLKPPAIGH